MNNTINQTDIYKTLHSHFFQMHTEHSPRETICWAIKKKSIYFLKLKFLNIIKFEVKILRMPQTHTKSEN